MNTATYTVIDTHFLARIIIYFNCIKDQTHTFLQIAKYYKKTAYVKAENFIKQKFNLNFQPITNLESLFLDHSFH